MFQAIVVDDEEAALNRFERVAAEDGRISLEEKFLYAEDAIAFVKEREVDLAFLDIEMPEMSGLELAERLLEADPYIRVIFVTAYNQYALDAFRAHAIGYLLKPLDKDELTEQIDLLCRRYGQRPAKSIKQHLKVNCLGQFSVSAEAVNEPAIRWKTAKAEELFALLIHYQGRVISRESLIDTLWPEVEPEKSANLFRVTCTYLRTALAEKGFGDILAREWNGYKINTELIACDLFEFGIAVRSISSLGRDKLKEISELYTGEYLEGKLYEWAAGMRTQLESDFKRIQYRLADEFCANGCEDNASRELERVLAHDPCEEEAVARLVQLKIQEGDITSAAKVYKRYEKILKDELGLLPSGKIRGLFSDQAI